MAYGVVLLPDPTAADAFIELSHAVGRDADPINLLGDHAPPHVSVLHLDVPDERAGEIADFARARTVRLTIKIIGLLYAPMPAGDHYVPQGGCYAGIEVVRRPDLDAVHREFLAWAGERAMTPLGAVGADYRPHVTLAQTAGQPALPPYGRIPLGEFEATLASGPIGPYGTFPSLGRKGATGHSAEA